MLPNLCSKMKFCWTSGFKSFWGVSDRFLRKGMVDKFWELEGGGALGIQEALFSSWKPMRKG